MIQKISARDLKFIAASHEDKKNPGVLKKVLFEKKDFSKKGKISMINWARLLQGKSFRTHYHQDMDEVFIIVSGKARIKAGKTQEVLEKGDAVLISAGQVHTMKNIGRRQVDYIVVGVTRGLGGKTVVI